MFYKHNVKALTFIVSYSANFSNKSFLPDVSAVFPHSILT